MHISKQLFSEVLDKLSPSTAETEVFEGHRRVIGKILKGDDVAAVLPIGSRRRGTALAQTSDYDLLVLYRRRTLVYAGKLTSPSTVLRRLKKAICKRYPHSDIRRDGQAIVVRFAKSGCSIDLVPAYFVEPGAGLPMPARNYPIYGIPDGKSKWTVTSPPAHDNLLKNADISSGHKLRNVARLLKFWTLCYSPSVPLTSFACEVLLLNGDVCRPGRSYRHCLWQAFKLLAARENEVLTDPLSLSKGIQLALTKRQRALIRSKSRAARILARRALREKNPKVAGEMWAQIFNGKLRIS